MRLSVPFGHRKNVVGILLDVNENTPPDISQNQGKTVKLRHIHQVLDTKAALDADILELCQWCANYYHYPLGEACHLALPSLLRKTEPSTQKPQALWWQLTPQGQTCSAETFGRAKKQLQAWECIKTLTALSPEQAKSKEISRTTITTLIKKGILETVPAPQSQTTSLTTQTETKKVADTPLTLNEEQIKAVNSIQMDRFTTYLLDGVTGSGKTEVYLQAITKAITNGKQVLVLVPEIGLTPQTLDRFEKRFNVPILTLHSGMSDKQRFATWESAQTGSASIVIGTRSAIFTPLSQLGLIIVDEEHDLSYKQQDGMRYYARDVAIIRAQKKNIPIILGSATPSLETLHNALHGRFRHLQLTQRATSAPLPKIQCVEAQDDHLSEEVIHAIRETLDKEQQVLVFINRRGYAPTLICQDCGWISQCNHCDNRMTLHQPASQRPQLHCHQCETKTPAPNQCPNCHSHRLQPLGHGTQRSEEQLNQRFKQTPILRIDRDNIRRKGELENALDTINSQQPCILVGTQMLAKGHHFSNVSLVVVLGLDNGFFSSDFRGSERMGQLLTQVAGRSGREKHSGTVLLQTQFPEHPLLKQLIEHGYSQLATQLLAERQLGNMPPYEYLALIRCHAQQPNMAAGFLQQARQLAENIIPANADVQYIGPLPAIIEKRNNRYYYQLQIKATNRRTLHHLLGILCSQLEKQRAPRGLHWLTDVDPQEM